VRALLPCRVTAWILAREFTAKYALKLCLKQIAGAAGFSLFLAWGGTLLV
jgi:hypothetical protein